MVNWSSDDIVAWKTEARDIHQELLENLDDREWDYINNEDKWALERKIGFSLFGEPKHLPSKSNKHGYDVKMTKKVHRICDLIYKECGNLSDIYISFSFVTGKINNRRLCLPIFRLLTSSMKHIILDHNGRVYKNWNDYQTKNKLPKCLVCYPENGKYQSNLNGEVLLSYETSPSCDLSTRICNQLDLLSTGVALASGVAGAIGLFLPLPVPLTIAATAGGIGSGIYGIIRGSYKLHDRTTHKQTISLTNREAQLAWITFFLGCVFGRGGPAGVRGLAEVTSSRCALGTTGQCVINFFSFGALPKRGLIVIKGLALLVEKLEKNTLTDLDVFQWSSSVFFFANVLIDMETANGIIKDALELIKKRNLKEDSSQVRMTSFERFLKDSSGEGVIENNTTHAIKGISIVDSKVEFFRLAIRAKNVDEALIKDGIPGARGRNRQDRLDLFLDLREENIQPVYHGINEKSFKISYEELNYAESIMHHVRTLLEEVFTEKKSIVIGDDVQFLLKGEFKDRLIILISRHSLSFKECTLGKREISSLIAESEKFSCEKRCATKEEFMGYTEFLFIYKKSKLKQMQKLYHRDRSILIGQIGDDFDGSELDSKWGIKDSSERESEFLSIISQEIENSNENLKKEYGKYDKEVNILNQSGEIKFNTKYGAINQYYHCSVIDLEKPLSPSEYFEIIRNTASDERFKVGVRCTGENSKLTLYYNENIPVAVRVLETMERALFQYVAFKYFEEFS